MAEVEFLNPKEAYLFSAPPSSSSQPPPRSSLLAVAARFGLLALAAPSSSELVLVRAETLLAAAGSVSTVPRDALCQVEARVRVVGTVRALALSPCELLLAVATDAPSVFVVSLAHAVHKSPSAIMGSLNLDAAAMAWRPKSQTLLLVDAATGSLLSSDFSFSNADGLAPPVPLVPGLANVQHRTSPAARPLLAASHTLPAD